MAERAVLAGAFVSAEARNLCELPGVGAAILPTGHSAVIRQVLRGSYGASRGQQAVKVTQRISRHRPPVLSNVVIGGKP
jgi:hypothetical protein